MTLDKWFAAAWTAVLAVIVGGGAAHSAAGDLPEPPVAVFSELDGEWAGEFAGFDGSGRELYRIMVRQWYETKNDSTQAVRIEDTMPDGSVITGEGVNTASIRSDGTLRLSCTVRKSDGTAVYHDGRLVAGAGGGDQIIWYSSEPGRSETFLESVEHYPGGTWYQISGMGIYGDLHMLMAGKYHRVEPD